MRDRELRISADLDALEILTGAKVAAFTEVLDRAFGNRMDSIYDAAEQWRTTANAWDHVHRAVRIQMLGGVS